MENKTAKYNNEYNLQIGHEFFPVNNKPVEIVNGKVKKYDHEYKARAIFEQIGFARHFVYLMHCLLVWKKSITEKSKTCINDNHAKNDKEYIPKAISDPESHFLTVNI